MGFRQLQYMLKVAEEKSFTKAAQKLKIAQPSLSQYILNLEQSIGIVLFDRTTNPISLTYAGEIFSQKAKEILTLHNELVVQMQEMAGLKIGKIRIGISQTAASYLMANIFPNFIQKFPGVEIELVESSSSIHMEQLILDGRIDLATLILPIQNHNLSYQIIQKDELLLGMSIDHPAAKKLYKKSSKEYPFISLKDLQEEKFILPPETQRSRKFLNLVFEEAGYVPKVLLEAKAIDTINAIILSTIAIGFTIEQTLRADQKDKIALFSVGHPATIRTVVLAYKKEGYLSKVAQEFLQMVEEYKNKQS